MDFSLNIFTLNCWGIPFISKNRKERLEALVLYLNESAHEVVCLQEIWSENDFNYLKNNLSNVFPHSHYFYSGVLGSGLCVFSRWLIEDVFFHQWSLNGYIHKVQHGDWFGGKGVGLCRLRIHEKLVNVYCTHLHAEYDAADDMYLAHRVLQALSAAELVRMTAPPAHAAVLAGDLNAAPGDLAYRLITQLPCLTDPFDLTNEHRDPSISRATGTSDNIRNSYSDPKQTDKLPEGKRIDHILFLTQPGWEARVINFGNPLSARVPGQPFSYSDHDAVCLQLQLSPSKNTNTVPQKDLPASNEVVCEAIRVCEQAQETVNRSRKLYLMSSGLIFMFFIGTVGFWPNRLLFDLVKVLMTALCLYALMMGTMWNRIEANSLKAGLSALNNINRSQRQSKKSLT